MATPLNKNLELVSSQNQVKNKKDQMLENIKMMMLEDLKLDDKLTKRKSVMEEIAKARENKEFPTLLHIGANTIKISEKKGYAEWIAKYKTAIGNEEALTQLDKEFAEEIILDIGKIIEFSSTEQFDGKTAEQEAKASFERLNQNEKHNKKIELIKKTNGEVTHFVIKRTEAQLKEIERAEKAYEAIHGTEDEETSEQKQGTNIGVPTLQEPTETNETTQKLLPSHPEQKLLPPHIDEEKVVETINEPVELTATISDTTKITRTIAEREAGEKLRDIYKNTARYKPRSWPTKAGLFLGRGYIKDHYTRKYMDMKADMQRKDNLVKGADRHEMENEIYNNLNSAGIIDEENYPETYKEIQIVIDQYTKGQIKEADFKKDFSSIIEDTSLDANQPSTAKPNRKPLVQIIKENDIQQMSSNIVEKINEFRAQQDIAKNIAEHIRNNPTETEGNFDIFARKEIVRYFNTYKKNPEFLKTFKINLDDKNTMHQLSNLQAHEGALKMIAAKTLKMKIQILTNGDEAYDVKQEGNTMTKIGDRWDKPIADESKLGKWMEKHPFTKNAFGTLRGGAKLGMMITPAILFGLTGAGPLAIAGAAGTMAFTKTLFKKYSHYNKEHIDYQKNQANNLGENKKEREKLLNEISKMNPTKKFFLYHFGLGKKARKVRQYRDYVLTTHNQLEDSKKLADDMQTLLSKPILEGSDPDQLERLVARSLARLNFHKKTGQNFLGSTNKDEAEKEYQTIYRLVLTGSMRLDKELSDFENSREYKNEIQKIQGNPNKNDDKNIGFLKAQKRFKHRQTEKALLGATKAGGVAFGLSYLATTLASNKATIHTQHDQTYIQNTFALGKHDLATDNNIYTTSKDFFQHIDKTINQQPIALNYGGGTDATGVIPGHLTQTEYLQKATEVQKEIMQMTNISTTTKMNLVHEIQNKPREHVRAEKGFTNDYLHGMRCIEVIEQTAKGVNDCGTNAANLIITPTYDGSAYDIVGNTYHNAGERIAQGGLAHTQATITPENIIPIPVPGFMNTFQKTNDTEEETTNTQDNYQRKTRTPAPKFTNGNN